MMELTTEQIKQFNQLLNFSYGNYVKEETGYKGVINESYGTQGEYNEKFVYYSNSLLPKNALLRVTYRTDSYGNNEELYEIKIVQETTKTVTVYEPI